MSKVRLLGALAALFVAGAALAAGPLYTHKSQPGTTTLIDGLGVNATRNTGWVLVNQFNAISFGVTFTDANDSVTALTWQCEESNSSSTAAGSGYDVCSAATSNGTTTYTCPWTGSLTTGTAEKFAFRLENLKMDYVRCAFSATGTPAAADVVTVTVESRVTP